MILSRTTLLLVSLGLAALATSGCAPVLIGGAATAGVAVAQERTVGDAIDDTIIQARVKDRLLQQSGNLFLRVGTEVLEGRVLLTGSVANPQDRVEAVRITWTVPGVREVLNEIQVAERGGVATALADARTTATLRFQLMGDRNIVDINYSIDTVNGIVYLMGIAQNQAELDRVVGYARNINGVRQVISHVVLRNDPRR
jgi:osmotically-inducible protein OsmY